MTEKGIRGLVDELQSLGLERLTFHYLRGSDSIPIESLYGYLIALLEGKESE